MNEIEVLDEREHILHRSQMYLGSLSEETSKEFILENNKIIQTEIKYIPALFKIINEIIDNVFDIAIKTEFKICDTLNVTIADNCVEVSDNGTGIPVKKCYNKNTKKEEYMPFTAWGHAMSGSNFNKDSTSIGSFGVGSFCVNVWSVQFSGISDDGINRYEVTFRNNASEFTEKVSKSKKRGVTVKFYPDLARFGIDRLNENYIRLVEQRLMNMSICFPKMNIKFNGKRIVAKSFKNYISLFCENYEFIDTDNYSFAVIPSPTDEFQSFSYVNGLNIKDGGTHVDVIVNSIVGIMRESLCKKYKTLKPADIKNRLMLVGVFTNFKNPKFNSQTKEKLTNSVSEVNQYLGEIDYQNLAKKILKNKAITDPIVEVFKIKEELKNRQELKTLNKPKKIKDEHYLPATKESKYICILEGLSAQNGVVPAFGREEFAYYCLRGKPLNVWTASQSKFTANKELSTLYKILKSTGTEEDMPDGEFYRISVDGKEMIVNENDSVKISGKWIDVKELLRESEKPLESPKPISKTENAPKSPKESKKSKEHSKVSEKAPKSPKKSSKPKKAIQDSLEF